MGMTGYEKFQEMVKDKILEYMPKEYQNAAVTIMLLRKENDRLQAGLIIKRDGEETAMSMDLASYYTEFRDGFSETAVLKRMAERYLSASRTVSKLPITSETVRDYGMVKDKIQVQLVNREMNRERLRNCPYREIEGTDLAAVFCMKFYAMGRECGSALVTGRLMELWGVTAENLYDTALKNTMAQAPAEIISMSGLVDGTEEPKPPEEVSCGNGQMYVLDNGGNSDGAAVILYPGVLQALAENSGSSFYILPNSTREVILINDDGVVSLTELQYMLMESNRGAIPQQEILSDQIYYYDGKEQKISQATTPEETREALRELNAIQYGSLPEYDMER